MIGKSCLLTLVAFATVGACADVEPSESGISSAEALAQPLVGTVAAPNMTTKSGGAPVGTVWAFYTNGYLAHAFDFPSSGAYELVVRAFGTAAGGVWPNLQVSVDGAVVGNVAINSKSLSAFPVKANVAAGHHTIKLAFTNDAVIAGEDRNVWIADLTVNSTDPCSAPSPPATTTTPPPPPPPAGFDVKAFLGKYTPLRPNEGHPSGVPASWDWYQGATKATLTAPPNTGWTTWWTVAAVDTTLIRAANTKIELRDAKLLVLPAGSNTWVTYFVGSSIGGGGFKSDFSGSCAFGAVSMGVTAISLKPLANCLDHIWPTNPAFTQVGSSMRAAISVASVRLVKDDPNGPDDRASSHYLVEMGADWRSPDGNCAKNASGQLVCSNVEGGTFIYPKNYWRSAVMSTMSSADLNALPLPPVGAFLLPDGTMPTE